MRPVLVLLLALVVAPSSESGVQNNDRSDVGNSGNEFLELCKNTENQSDDKIIHSFIASVCFGWVQGFMAGVYVSDDARHTPKEQRMLCVPDKATTIQAFRIVKKYIEEHPESAHMKTRVLAAVSLMKTFPCGN
jgi:hypothetical protein